MNITTKYDVGQRVWIMHDNEPQEWIVKVIHLGFVDSNHQPTPTYDLHTTAAQPLCGVFERSGVYEYKIAATKRDLLNSFLTDND